MFEQQIYIERRKKMLENFDSGLLLFLGNDESPSNYSANTFPFRQDSTFLYYIGLDLPGLAAVIDVDSNTSTLFGNDFSVDDIVWMGPQPKVNQLAESSGMNQSENFDHLHGKLSDAIKRGKKIHFLPQYKSKHFLLMGSLLGIKPERVNDYVSTNLIKAAVKQRSVKSKEEIEEIDKAVDIAYRMHTAAMKMIKPGMSERKIAGMIEGIAYSIGAGLAFRPIVSIHGQTLHNHHHNNIIEEGCLLVNDSGAESVSHYASDITRTIPATGSFTDKQKEIYQIVLNSQMKAIEAVYPGVSNRDLHLLSAKTIVEGLSTLGVMKGNPDEAVQKGAHALFFPHGLGHMMGLDVHDMEGLGENFVGYDDKFSRSDQFGLAYLRLAKPLAAGNVFTIEPGIYFIPELIDKWKSENKFPEFINYERLEDYRDFGGIRIEDDILVTNDGYRILGKAIPKTIQEVEELASN
jgi:Xaa-Pro aminopeptidase